MSARRSWRKQLARILKVEFLRFDMSEYMEKHAVSRLIGAPPGYVGYEEGGLLIDAVRKSPHAVLLLDEIEKAHPDLFAILLQVMDHATLTDTHGRHADFRHVILIMTTNAGARDLSGRRMGFFETAQGSKAVGVIERMFAPEFRNRLDATVHFSALGTTEIELRGGQARRRAAAAGSRPQDHHRADAGGTGVAGGEGLRQARSAPGRWPGSSRKPSRSRCPNCCSSARSRTATRIVVDVAGDGLSVAKKA